MVGIPNNAAFLMVLPLLLVPFTLLMAAFSITGWIGKYWRTWRKLYYSVVTLAGVGSVIILGNWGMLSVFFH